MRYLLTTIALAVMAVLVTAPVYAGDEQQGGGKKESAEGKGPNAYSPVSGTKIDKDKSVTVGIKLGDKMVVIQVASPEEADLVGKANDDLKKLYVEAAKHHKMVKEGKLEKIKGVESKEDKVEKQDK
jgi:hypothetical protein